MAGVVVSSGAGVEDENTAEWREVVAGLIVGASMDSPFLCERCGHHVLEHFGPCLHVVDMDRGQCDCDRWKNGDEECDIAVSDAYAQVAERLASTMLRLQLKLVRGRIATEHAVLSVDREQFRSGYLHAIDRITAFLAREGFHITTDEVIVPVLPYHDDESWN